MSHGLEAGGDAGDHAADDKMLSLDDLKKQIQQVVDEDPFVSEQAPKVVAWKELSDPEAAFGQCTSPAEVQKMEASITERVNHSKTAIGALRRSIRDRITNLFYIWSDRIIKAKTAYMTFYGQEDMDMKSMTNITFSSGGRTGRLM